MSQANTYQEVQLHGIAASSGVIQGRAWVYKHNQLDIPERSLDDFEVVHEIERFEQAIVSTREEIMQIRDRVAKSLSEAEAAIFDAHLMVLEDCALIEEVTDAVRQQLKNIEYCYHSVAQRYIAFFQSMEDEYLRERVTDIRDVSRRLLHNLMGSQQHLLTPHEGDDWILVAEDISPSDTVGLNQGSLLGFLTDSGGKTSHAVIMARSLGLPAVVGLHDATTQIRTGDPLLVDGSTGRVVVHPNPESLANYGQVAEDRLRLEARFCTSLSKASQTRDGWEVDMMLNIEGSQDLKNFSESGAGGVGLYRTESLFIRKNDYPDEATQYSEYAAVVQAAAGSPVTMRSLDMGGDKLLSKDSDTADRSFMGFRAIRFCLEQPELFKIQLRAILRASALGPVKLMYPLISGIDELRAANRCLGEAKAELTERGEPFDSLMKVGVMIEVPSAALIVDLIADEVDFFSIGTNDLIQYLMAVDRLNDKVSHLYDPTHPAVIRTLKSVIDAATHHGKPVSVCGEMAGESIFTPLLVGLGATGISLACSLMPEVKYVLRALQVREAHKLVDTILQCGDSQKALKLLQDFREELLAGS